MVSEFEGHLAQYAEHSKVIERIVESHYSEFGPKDGDGRLLWDKDNHLGVMNRHNYALLYWLDYFHTSSSKPYLIHVDAHEDMGKPSSPDKSRISNPGYVAEYIDQIKVKEFIEPAIELGLFSRERLILRGHSSNKGFNDFDELIELADNNPVIFDLDLDIYQNNPLIQENYSSDSHRRAGYNFEDSYEAFARMIGASNLTTIAFSPDYLNSMKDVEHHLQEISRHHSNLSTKSGIFSKITDII